MATKKTKKYVTVCRVESRTEGGEKIVIKANTPLNLTVDEASEFGSAITLVQSDSTAETEEAGPE